MGFKQLLKGIFLDVKIYKIDQNHRKARSLKTSKKE
jgi:hypothetical protein